MITKDSSLSEIRCVSFDAAGTLIHLAESVGKSYSRIAKLYQIHVEPALIDRSFKLVWKRTPPPFHPDGHAIRDEKQWWYHLVFAVFEEALGGVRFRGADAFNNYFEHLYRYFGKADAWVLDSDVLPVLDELKRRGIRVAVISNFDEQLEPILAGLGILDRFNPLVVSNQVQASKPSERIFQYAIEKIGVPAAQILHVGDDLECDYQGAIDVGMKAILVGKKYGELDRLLDVVPEKL